MTQIYNLSITNDFGGSLFPYQLTQFINYVNNDGSITATFNHVNDMTDDIVECEFSSTLSAGEQNSLSTLAGNFGYVIPEGTIMFPIIIPNVPISSITYELVQLFTFPGTNKLSSITNFKILSFIDTGNYDIKIYDYTNDNIICTANFTNTNKTNNDLGTLSYLPATEATFEVHAKVDNVNNTVNINNLSIYY